MGLLAEWTALTEWRSRPQITHLCKLLVRHMRPCTDTSPEPHCSVSCQYIGSYTVSTEKHQLQAHVVGNGVPATKILDVHLAWLPCQASWSRGFCLCFPHPLTDFRVGMLKGGWTKEVKMILF